MLGTCTGGGTAEPCCCCMGGPLDKSSAVTPSGRSGFLVSM